MPKKSKSGYVKPAEYGFTVCCCCIVWKSLHSSCYKGSIIISFQRNWLGTLQSLNLHGLRFCNSCIHRMITTDRTCDSSKGPETRSDVCARTGKYWKSSITFLFLENTRTTWKWNNPITCENKRKVTALTAVRNGYFIGIYKLRQCWKSFGISYGKLSHSKLNKTQRKNSGNAAVITTPYKEELLECFKEGRKTKAKEVKKDIVEIDKKMTN